MSLSRLASFETIKSNSRLTARISSATVLLMAITVLAFILRFHWLGVWSFWVDEIITVTVAGDAFADGLLPVALEKRGLSLYLIGLSMKLFGTSEWSARLVPALIGVATIVIVYFPIRRATNSFVGLVTALLLAVSPFHIYYSQNARYVSTFVLFYVLAGFLLFLAVETDRRRYYVLSTLFFALVLWERLYAIVFFPTAVAYLVLLQLWPAVKRPAGLNWRKIAFYLGANVGVVLLYFVLFPFGPGGAEARLVAGEHGPLGHMLALSYELTIPIVVMAGLSALMLLLIKPTRLTLFAALAAAGPIMAVAALSLSATVETRYMIGSIVFVFLLVALGLHRLWATSTREMKVFVCVVLLALAGDAIMADVWYFDEANTQWPDWRGTFRVVDEGRAPQAVVLSNYPRLGEYYLNERVPTLETFEPIQSALDKDVSEVWIVTDKQERRIDPAVRRWMTQHTEIVYDSPMSTIYRYRRAAP